MFVAHFHLTFPFDVRTWGREGAVSAAPSPPWVPNTAPPAQPPPHASQRAQVPPCSAKVTVPPHPHPPARVPAGTTGSTSLMLSCCFPPAAANETLRSKDSSAGTEPGASPPLPWQQDLRGKPVGMAALRGRRQQPQQRQPQEQISRFGPPKPRTKRRNGSTAVSENPILGRARPGHHPGCWASAPGSGRRCPPATSAGEGA